MSALTRPPRDRCLGDTPALLCLVQQNMRGWDCRASLPHLPFLTTIVRRQELAPNRERGAYESLAWLPWLRRACPSATLDKQSVFSCRATIANPRRRAQACVSMYTDLVISYAEHSPSMTSGANSADSAKST